MTDADGGVFMDDAFSRSWLHSHIGLGVSYTPHGHFARLSSFIWLGW